MAEKTNDLNELVAVVNQRIQEGWQPQGGISITVGKIDNEHKLTNEGTAQFFYVQALTRN